MSLANRLHRRSPQLEDREITVVPIEVQRDCWLSPRVGDRPLIGEPLRSAGTPSEIVLAGQRMLEALAARARLRRGPAHTTDK